MSSLPGQIDEILCFIVVVVVVVVVGVVGAKGKLKLDPKDVSLERRESLSWSLGLVNKLLGHEQRHQPHRR